MGKKNKTQFYTVQRKAILNIKINRLKIKYRKDIQNKD